ncbi:MAG: hydantoinase/oxoprolinase family protein [Acidimicrobiia bacterium]
MALTIGVDVGGTFTDVVAFDGETITGRKVPTTPDQAIGVATTLEALGIGDDSVFLHGTTAGTNALLEGRGARTALVTTAGFEDVVEIGRQARPSLYDSFADRPPPLVERSLRFGFDGDVTGLVDSLSRESPEAVAVALVRSYLEPGVELDLAQRLGSELDVPVSVGAELSPAFREYERVATTVLNAFLTPEVAGYLDRLDATVQAGRKLVMTSSGGLLPFGSAVGYAGRLVLSGPAAGVVAATELGQAKGYQSVISFDMGGTSTDVCRIARARSSANPRHGGAGRVNRVPSLPVRSIGAGGGSLGWIDGGGALRVGPASAGSIPGPAAYGLGGDQATVTDANTALGRIPSDVALGGSVALDLVAARRALAVIGSAVGLGIDDAASGIVEVVDTHMERALRAVSVEEGVDPRDSVLVAFGGAGGLHASRLAKRLGMVKTLIPPLSGVFSALGLLLARPSSDATQTVMLVEGSSLLPGAVEAIVAKAWDTFSRDHGFKGDDVTATGEVRYVGQAHELAVPLTAAWAEIRESFEADHRSRFGFIREGQPIELVDVRAEVRGPAPLSWTDLPLVTATEPPFPGLSMTLVEGREAEAGVWQRGDLPTGFETSGPAIVIERDSAIWLEPDDTMSVHDDGTLEIVW